MPFKIHVNCFMAWDDSPGSNVILMHVVGEGPVLFSEFRDLSSL